MPTGRVRRGAVEKMRCAVSKLNLSGRQLIAAAMVLLLSLLLPTALYALGRYGPTLLYEPGENYYWRGVGRLPACTWQSMKHRGQKIVSDANDLLYLFWGDCPAAHGDIMLAVGPDGIAAARCSAPNAPHGGCYHAWLFVPHVWMFVLVLGFGVGLLVAARLTATCLTRLRAGRSREVGRCRKCGYDLRGLPECRCPECGLAFEPGCMRQGAEQSLT